MKKSWILWWNNIGLTISTKLCCRLMIRLCHDIHDIIFTGVRVIYMFLPPMRMVLILGSTIFKKYHKISNILHFENCIISFLQFYISFHFICNPFWPVAFAFFTLFLKTFLKLSANKIWFWGVTEPEQKFSTGSSCVLFVATTIIL